MVALSRPRRSPRPYRPRAGAAEALINVTIRGRGHVTHLAPSRRACRIMVMAASWALSDSEKKQLSFSVHQDLLVRASIRE